MTSLVETTAELRHREVLAQAEAHAESVHAAKTEELVEALRVLEGIESQRALDAMMSKEQEVLRLGAQYRENLKHEAHEHVRFQQAQMNEKIQAYQRVIDANHQQSLSSKEEEILELRRQAENDRITQLEQMVQAQMQHNLKLQSMLDSQFAQARPSPIVETAAMTTTATETVTPSATGFEFVRPTSKAVAAAPPPKTNFPPTPKRPIVFSPPQGRTLGEEIVDHDPKYSGPTQVKKEPGISRSSDAPRLPEGAAANLFGANPSNKRGGSPVPTQRYSLTDLGPDDMDYFEPGDDDGPDGNDPVDEMGMEEGAMVLPHHRSQMIIIRERRIRVVLVLQMVVIVVTMTLIRTKRMMTKSSVVGWSNFWVVLSTRRMMIGPKSRKLTLLRSLLFLWPKPIAIGESKRMRRW